MFSQLFKNKNKQKTDNTNIEKNTAEAKDVFENSIDEPEEITPGICRELIYKRKLQSESEFIKLIDGEIRYYAECGDDKYDTYFHINGDKLNRYSLAKLVSIDKKILKNACSIFRNKGFKVTTIENNDKLELKISWEENTSKVDDKEISFAEAFKEYIKGKTIAPEDRSVEFNKDYDYKTQEPIENTTEDEVDQMWIVLD